MCMCALALLLCSAFCLPRRCMFRGWCIGYVYLVKQCVYTYVVRLGTQVYEHWILIAEKQSVSTSLYNIQRTQLLMVR
jgi:hypothetical protein